MEAEHIFSEYMVYGTTVCTQGKNGLDAWNAKKIGLSAEGVIVTLSNRYMNYFHEVDFQLPSVTNDQECSITIGSLRLSNLDNNGNIDERNHYLIQVFRIPYLESFALSRRKLAQIAYNIGQCKAVFHEYPEEVQKWVLARHILEFETLFYGD